MALHAAGERTSVELAELFGVARSTVYRAVERAMSAGDRTRRDVTGPAPLLSWASSGQSAKSLR